MSEILGIDLGNSMVNTSTGVTFESKVLVGATSMNKDDIKIKYGNMIYTLGTEDGALNISKTKHKKINYKLCLLAAIAKSIDKENISCKTVVGVPVERFDNKDLVESIKNEIKSYKNQCIDLNGKKINITIEDADVFCESGIVFRNKNRFRKEKTLVFDLGGSTGDISLWNGLRLVRSKTYKEGMITLYENIIKTINGVYKVELKPYEAKEMVGKNEYIINQEKKNIEFVNCDVDNYMTGLVSYANQYFPEVDSVDSIQLVGGGGIMLEKWFKAEYERAELHENAAFANANTFKEVGEMIWN